MTDDPLMVKHKKLTGALIGIVEDYSLVNYMTLNVEVCHQLILLIVSHWSSDQRNKAYSSHGWINAPPKIPFAPPSLSCL